MKLSNFLNIGLIAAISTLAQPALAGSYDNDNVVQPQNACVTQLKDNMKTISINIEYIRLVQVENRQDQTLNISMASNYGNGDTNQILMYYHSNAEAVKALQELSDKINDCQYNAAQKRKMK